MYYLSFIYLWILYWASRNKDKELALYALIPFLIIPFLRFGVGSDYFSYQYLYDYLPIESISSSLKQFPNIEPGFILIMYLGRRLGLSFHIYFAIISCLISYIFYKSIEKDKKILSLILYFSLFYLAWNLNAIRQGIVLIVFSSYFFKEKRSLIKTILLILILSSIHISALILIPLVLVNKIDFKAWHLALVAFIGYLFNKLPFESLLTLLKDYRYLGKAYEYKDLLNPVFIDFPTLVRIFLFLGGLIYFNYLNGKGKDRKQIKTVQFYLLGLAIYFYFKPVEVIASRTSIYGYFLIVYILPSAYLEFEHNKHKIKYFLLAFILSFSTLGIYKELQGAATQSGYLKKPIMLNTVSVFNKNRDDFYHTFNIMYNIKESSKDDNHQHFKGKDLALKIAQDSQYIAVKFPDTDLYGIIDREGNVIENPRYKKRPKVYGKYVQDKSGILDVKDIAYRIIGSENQIRTYRIIDDISNQENQKLLNQTLNFPKEVLEFEDIAQKSFKHYFKTEANGRMERVSYNIPFNYEIIQTHLRGESLVLINSIDGVPYQSKLYFKVTPYEGSDILVGETEHNYEYINKKGETIWLEAK